ncbi:flagellar hook-length control protein FliK [Bosea sp. ASV33]|uniref:flagellar hook-length control protein FliK n=1 Tax=Bosea sp. ASV33 TaxID=2795106 RepID=UPI0018EB67A3|nr:flagellar hook-length control protein FliK [Bosea sp. ASV33]
MPIQSAFTSQATAEAPAARSRAAQTEPREGGEVFTLPETEAVDTGGAKAGAAGKIAASGEVVAAKEAAATETVVDPAKVQAQAKASQTTNAPAVPVTAPAASGKPASQAAKTDATGIAFLIAMAAAQAGTQPEAAGEGSATKAGGADGEAGKGETKKEGKAAAEDKGEAAAAAAVPVTQNQAVATPVAVTIVPALLQQGALIAVDGAAGDATEAISAEGGAKKDTAKPALATATAGLPLVTTATPEQPQAGAALAADGKAAAGGVHVAAMAGQGVQEFADIRAKADQPAAANGAPAPADAKALDALQQQPAAPFDLSSLLQVPGKPGHDRLLQPFDPNAAAGTAPGTPGQGTANSPPTPIHVVPIEIGLRAMSGSRQFDIRLDPEELGRVDVNLSISDKGEVSAKLVVDRVETLHLLQRDARTLERAFEQAGLKPSDGGVDITLRDPSDQSAFRQNRQQDEAPQRQRQSGGAELTEDTTLSTDLAPQRRVIRLGGVDLSI